jgi:hypothetical protein
MSDKTATAETAGKAAEKAPAAAAAAAAAAAPSPAAAAAAAPPAATTDASTTLLGPEHWAQAAEDLPAEDDDSALGTNQESTASITSSILEYRTILGRTFHSERGDGHYW